MIIIPESTCYALSQGLSSIVNQSAQIGPSDLVVLNDYFFLQQLVVCTSGVLTDTILCFNHVLSHIPTNLGYYDTDMQVINC